MEEQGNTTTRERRRLSCDQEAWLIDRLWMFARATRAIIIEADVRAEEGIVNSAVDGLVHGTAEEIAAGIFDMSPEYANLRRPPQGRNRTMGLVRHRTTRITFDTASGD